MKCFFLFVVLVVLVVLLFVGMLLINVGVMYEYVVFGQGVLFKCVCNIGNVIVFVRVEIVEVCYGFDGKVIEVLVDIVCVDGQGNVLIVSLLCLIVFVQGQQVICLLFQGDCFVECYYWVCFVLVMLKCEDEFVLIDVEVDDYCKGLLVGVNVFIGYGVFVIVYFDGMIYDMCVDVSDVQIVVCNVGNIIVVFDDVCQCGIDGKVEFCLLLCRIYLLLQCVEIFLYGFGQMYCFEIVEGDVCKCVLFNLQVLGGIIICCLDVLVVYFIVGEYCNVY